MNSAIKVLSLSGFGAVVYRKRAAIDSGEFIVIVVAVMMASHDQILSFLALASCSILEKASQAFGDAGIATGQGSALSINDLRVDDSSIALNRAGSASRRVR
jgi:hypothetical protein